MKHAVTSKPPSTKRESHVVLLLDKHIQSLPLESMPCLRSTSVSRVPCFSSLVELVNARVEKLNRDRVRYVLNPGGDLVRTQSEFQDILSGIGTGIVGVPPTAPEFLDCIDSDVFLYFGHGGGEGYINTQSIRSLPNIAFTILLGCSSGRLHPNGEFDSVGTPVDYLLGGAQTVISVLWDVTDRDIDRFGKRFLRDVGIEGEGGVGAGRAVVGGREDCLLKLLVGGGVVMYGLPVWF